MTEIYHGPWHPLLGDTPKVKVPDVYHRYPVSSQAEETERQIVQPEQQVAQGK